MSRQEPDAVGVIVSSLATELAGQLIKSTYQYYVAGGHVDLVFFTQNPGQPATTPPTAAMNVAEAYTFPGPLVATSLDSAAAALRCPGPTGVVFYLNELEWVGSGRTSEEMAAVYRHPRLTLVARSEADRATIEDCWNVAVAGVVQDGQVAGLIEMARKGRGV